MRTRHVPTATTTTATITPTSTTATSTDTSTGTTTPTTTATTTDTTTSAAAATTVFGAATELKLVDEKKTWADAKIHCEGLGGTLAIIDSSAKNQEVRATNRLAVRLRLPFPSLDAL